jgi:O-antigen/teichoic acid export membrane protein
VRGYGRDILWAYAVSAMRVASWVVVCGTLYRRQGPEAFALLTTVRWTLGLLNYASAGLGPAILHYAAKSQDSSAFSVQSSTFPPSSTLHPPSSSSSLKAVYTTGIRLSWIAAAIAGLLLWSWALTQGRARGVEILVGLFGTGMLIDMAADAWGAVIQSRGLMRRDYQAQTGLEFLWAVLATIALLTRDHLGLSWQAAVGGSYLFAATFTAILRAWLAHRLMRTLNPDLQENAARSNLTKKMLAFGGLVVLAQIADYFYAPTDILLIQWLIDLKTVALYAPAVQMDAGIWLLASGLSTAILPMSAAAFGKGNVKDIRRFYIQGTAINLAVLAILCVLAWLAAPGIFKLWLGNKMRETQQVLPLVFIATTLGGSAAVGRSVLLAIGKVHAFTASALIAGPVNAILSFIFVKYLHLGLRGIILGTIVAVVGRCAIWMPWYVLRALRRLSQASKSESSFS